MAKKKVKQVPAVQEPERMVKAVRLDLTPSDHAKLVRIARRKGLSMSSYARMVIMERIELEEPSRK